MDISKAKMWVQTVLMDKNGNVTSVGPWTDNQTLADGTLQLGYMLTGLATGAGSGGFIWVCAGSGASGSPPISTSDDRLGGTLANHASAHEYIANGSRKQLLSSASTGNPITAADWTSSVTTINGVTYNWLLQGYVQYGPSDANGVAGSGVPFCRYGLANASACPATVTGISGTLFNEVIDTITNYVTDSNILQVNIQLRI